MAARSRLFAGMALGALGAAGLAAMMACEAVPLTAVGASIFLQANPGFVPANGGRALVTALLTEPAGTLVPDGTEVFFFTTLGSIEERVKTVDGIAKTFFISDSRSGLATVTAFSGGSAPVPSPSASPSPTPGAAFADSASGSGSASVSIVVGSSLPATVLVTANPQLLASTRQATIVANVFDAFGNPVQNVPVVFTVSASPASPLQEFLDSGGAPQFTNSSGQAFDTLSTRAPNGTTQKTVTVTATTPTGKLGTVEVVVNYLAAS
jgi:hypothetical protein